MAVPAGALGPDKSNIPVLVTKLKKKSRKGRWDNRYFRANNHYLTRLLFRIKKFNIVQYIEDTVVIFPSNTVILSFRQIQQNIYSIVNIFLSDRLSVLEK